jgi:hypothetical protein
VHVELVAGQKQRFLVAYIGAWYALGPHPQHARARPEPMFDQLSQAAGMIASEVIPRSGHASLASEARAGPGFCPL